VQPLAAGQLAGAPAGAERSVALVGARLLDGTGGPPRDDVSVLVRDGRIAWVGDGRLPGDADELIELDGRTVLPGLIDAHVHLSSLRVPRGRTGGAALGADVRPYAMAEAAKATLSAGVTTVRDVGSHGREVFALREAIGLGLCNGPRILLCGQVVSVSSPGGRLFGSMYREADGPDEVRKATREQLRQGADLIKVMSTGALSVDEPIDPAQMTEDELAAVVSEAHRLGVRVASHAEGLDGIRLSIEAGVDTIEHGEQLHRAPELLARMAERGIVLVPTLSVFHAVSDELACHFAPKLVEQAKRLREDAYATVDSARRNGVLIAMGFDSHPHGSNVLEVVRLVEAGLTPSEAIVAATTVAAHACGLEDVGRVTEGALADLLVVDGDPLSAIGTLSDPASISLVMQGGHVIVDRVQSPVPSVRSRSD
jgi:imidazolonepropionase-like amidohydrolase